MGAEWREIGANRRICVLDGLPALLNGAIWGMNGAGLGMALPDFFNSVSKGEPYQSPEHGFCALLWYEVSGVRIGMFCFVYGV